MTSQLTTFIQLCSSNNIIILKTAAILIETCRW